MDTMAVFEKIASQGRNTLTEKLAQDIVRAVNEKLAGLLRPLAEGSAALLDQSPGFRESIGRLARGGAPATTKFIRPMEQAGYALHAAPIELGSGRGVQVARNARAFAPNPAKQFRPATS